MGLLNGWRHLLGLPSKARGKAVSNARSTAPRANTATTADPPATVFVNAAWVGLPPGTVVGPGQVIGLNAFATISGGVNAVDVLGTVYVAPGLYSEQVNITKTIQLLGAQQGVDARSRSGSTATESTITSNTPTGVVNLSADGIVLDGFTVKGNLSGPGIVTSSSHSGYLIEDNIVEDNVFGMYLNTNGTSLSVVRHNLIQNNNQAGAATGNGIYTDQGSASLYIYQNRFSGHINGSLAFYGSAGTQHDILIANNEMMSDSALAMVNSNNVTILGNTMIGIPYEAISVQSNNNHVQIEANVLHQNVYGVIVAPVNGPGTASTDVRLYNNNIQGNSTAGLRVISGGYSGTLNATNNWWGDASGPSGVGPGTGDAIVDPDSVVAFTPWLESVPPPEPTACAPAATPGCGPGTAPGTGPGTAHGTGPGT